MRNHLIALLLFCPTLSMGQTFQPEKDRPKLVVGIIIDQMRYDYLTRYWDKFGEDGFKKLVRSGFHCTNTHYNYVPTYTGPGHASIYSGTTPAIHGIIANNWFDRSEGKSVYVTSDNNAQGVGTSGIEGKQSPSRLLSTTIFRRATTLEQSSIQSNWHRTQRPRRHFTCRRIRQCSLLV